MGGQEMEAGHGSGSRATPNPQKVSRRSIRSGSEVRHGRVYDDSEESTIRAITPELVSPTTQGRSEHESIRPSPGTSRPHMTQRSVSARETSASVSNTDEDSAADNQQRIGQKRSKVRGDISSDASPSSFISKTRKRLGSITTGPQIATRDDGASSSGYPSAASPGPFPNLDDVRNQLPRMPRRAFSSESAVGLGTFAVRSSLLPSTDSSKLLHLMKTTCGRMHGILFFRPLYTSAWESGYCAINVAPGSLVCQKQGELIATKILLPDLRGCSVRTNYDSESQSNYISVVLPTTGFGYQLRPPVPETFDSWLAALLCWQPLRPRGIHNKMMKSQSVTMTERRPIEQRRLSDMSSPKTTAIVKVGRMALWDSPLPAGSLRHFSTRGADFESLTTEGPWRRVSCTLHENGTFKLLTEVDVKTICTVRLSHLARCAIQRLDKSVLNVPYCLAIYPQHSLGSTSSRTILKPLIVGLDSKIAYDAWYVLLRAFTAPELYGPENSHDLPSTQSSESKTPSSVTDMYRIERTLLVKITEAKLNRDPALEMHPASHEAAARPEQRQPGDIYVYADVLLGRDVRARTFQKKCSQSAFWAEEFLLPDLPPVPSTISVAVKVGNPGEQEWTTVAQDGYDLSSSDANHLSGFNAVEIASSDPDYGKVEILLDELEQQKSIEKWWQLTDKHGRPVGSILMRLTLSETIVLLSSKYEQISKLLHSFENGVTSQMAHVLGQELKRLSEILLDVFQESDTVSDWINTLIEEEIDGIYKETPPMRMRFSGRIHSNDSYESAEQRELLVRDLSRSAAMEANLLFRGNSLVTKALDAHMRRLGGQYLETTLGEPLRQILAQNPDCEVDPVKVKFPDTLSKNWSTLMSLTNAVWKAIASSASKCPPGMRMIFKHIRSCAEDRYGSFIKTVKYTSVSGFLFLRFFCPAVLNPKLFGLIEDHPPDRARRTFTLIAKSLNVLASMAKFGTKEIWMEPMNRFLLAATPEFKTFIEEICSISSLEPSNLIEPQFLAPMQIRGRLSPLSREGLPVLPYLLDAPKSFATLVDLWLNNVPSNITEATNDRSVALFHGMCLELRRRTKESVMQAEPAEKPNSNFEPQWQQMLSKQQQQQQHKNHNDPFEDSFNGLNTDTEITALPQRADSARARPPHIAEMLKRDGSASLSPGSAPAFDLRRMPYSSPYSGDSQTFLRSTNSSTVSFDAPDDGRKLPTSRDGSSKPGRLLDYLHPSRKKSRAGFNGERKVLERDDDD